MFSSRNNTSQRLTSGNRVPSGNNWESNGTSQRLVKAKLFSLDSQDYDIQFMFNPTQLDLSRSVKLNQPQGARSRRGQPKVSFAAPDPCVITLSKIVFDTYEEGVSVLDRYINQLLKSVQFIEQQKRPPIYIFLWGANDYLASCFVESVRYQLKMFLPDGTPVRAEVNLTLKEVDASVVEGQQRRPENVDRFGDSRESRLNSPERNRVSEETEQRRNGR
ncbi:MAG: phage tail protein [Desertifilum sp.]|nr:phage tail protein [Desertifilum sp.]